jgi:hypothetical protein
VRRFYRISILRLLESTAKVGRFTVQSFKMKTVEFCVDNNVSKQYIPSWQTLGQILLGLAMLLFVGMNFADKPKRIQPPVEQSLVKVLEKTFPKAQNLSALGPFGGEMGIENLVEFDLENGTHVVGRDFLQTGIEQSRFLEFLYRQSDYVPFLSAFVFPHRNIGIDPVQLEVVQSVCLSQIPVLQLHVMQESKWQNAWMILVPYFIEDPKYSYRLISLMVTGDKLVAQNTFSQFLKSPVLTARRIPFQVAKAQQMLMGRPCEP